MNRNNFMKAGFLVICYFYSLISNCQQPYELLITEIMADPTPSRGLPEIEFLEVYNSSNKPLQLSEYTLYYNTFQTNIPSKVLLPNEYAILVRNGNEAGFQDFGMVLSLPRLSLLNGGTIIRLVKENTTVFEVNYSADWYAEGREQGFSLEMIDLNYPCIGKANWTSSQSTNGGTPGKLNASAKTNPDTTPPKLLFFDAEASGSITFDFDEKLDTNAVKDVNNFVFSSTNGAEKVEIGASASSFRLILSNPLAENELVNISLKNITDCSGNVASDINLTVGNLPPTDSGAVVFNEVLFNPKLGGGDYIELYNRSENAVSLKNWSFANLNADNEMDDVSKITEFNLVFQPKSYLVFTENEDFLRSFYPKYAKESLVIISALPSMRNTDGTIFLLNNEGELFDRFDFSEDFHHPIIDDPDGISLEKIDVDISSNIVENWQSAAAEENYGTPGYQNSQANSSEEDEKIIWVEPLIFTPNGDGQDDETFLNFNFEKSGNVLTARIFSVSGVPLKLLAENKLMGVTGKLGWNGTDESGNDLPVGYYLFVTDVFNTDGTTKRYKKKVVLGRLN